MKLNVHFFIFLIISIIAIMNDIIIYIFGIEYKISLIISTILINSISAIFIKKNKIKIESNFSKSDFILVYILLFCICSFFKCDYSFDTKNYHIYLQENFFTDKINFDFFPGRTINSFLFPLGDRINYIFRSLLGYRFGVICSLYALIVIFYQTKKILKIIYPKLSNIKISLLSIIPIILYPVNEFAGTYYIDNYSCIILFQLVIIFLEEKDIFLEKSYLYFVGILLGIGAAIKVSNIILGSIILFFILFNSNIKSIRKLNIKELFFAFILFIFPIAIYVIDNLIQTGSPIYPYYNTIFKSEYFGNINWKDPDFGIPNLLYSLIWPIVIAIKPLYGNNFNYVGLIWGYGYIVCVITALRMKKNNVWKLSILSIICSIIWAIFLMGYARYAIIIPIMYFFVVVSFILEISLELKRGYNAFWKINKVKELLKIIFNFLLIIILIMLIIYDIFIGVKLYIEKAKDYIESFPFNYTRAPHSEEPYEIDGVWGCINNNSAMISLIRNKNTPIYNLDKWHYMYSEKTKRMFLEKVNNKKIYTIIDKKNYLYLLPSLQKNGFKKVGSSKLYINSSLQNKYNYWYIIQVEYVGEY